jgi:hypothetical protein
MSASSTSPSGFGQAEHNTTWQVWAACGIILSGTVVGGIALIVWMWPLFWLGVAMFVGGSIAAGLAGVMDEVSEFGPASPGESDA